MAAEYADDHAQRHQHERIEQEHALRAEPHHERRAYPPPDEKRQHVEAEERGGRGLVKACVDAAVDEEQAVDGRLSAVVEELGDDAPTQVGLFQDGDLFGQQKQTPTMPASGSSCWSSLEWTSGCGTSRPDSSETCEFVPADLLKGSDQMTAAQGNNRRPNSTAEGVTK